MVEPGLRVKQDQIGFPKAPRRSTGQGALILVAGPGFHVRDDEGPAGDSQSGGETDVPAKQAKRTFHFSKGSGFLSVRLPSRPNQREGFFLAKVHVKP